MRLWAAVLAAAVVLLSVGVVAADMSSSIAHVRDVIVDFWDALWSEAPDGSRTIGVCAIEDSGSGSSNVPRGVFGWLHDSIPSTATIDTYKNARIVTVESTLNWDTITSGTWNTYKASVQHCSDESLRSGLRMSCGGDYGSSAYIATVTADITSYLPDLTAAPYLATMQFIVVNFTNTTSPDKAAFVNSVAKAISEQTGNNFEILVVESVSGLDSAWVAESEVQYKQLTTKANWIDWEATTLRGNATKSRIYSSNESLLDNVSDYQYNILTKMRDSHSTSDQYSETDSVKVRGGDLILYNTGTAAPNTVASPAAGYYWDIHNDILCNNTVSFYVDDFTYVIREDSFEKIVMVSGTTSALWASPAYAEAITYLSKGTQNNNWMWTTENCDVKVELWDPSFVKSNAFMLHYEWVTTAPISDYTPYEYIIIGDNDATRLSTDVGRPDNTYGYLAMGDYANTDAWLNGKKASVDHWTDTCNVNLFLDEVDMGAAGANFSNRFKALVDYIRIDKGKRVITNVYTEYGTYSTYGDATLKESCFARWDGNVYTPTYSYGDISIDTAQAAFYAEHNVSILGVSFGALDDYDKMAYCAAAFAVVYGFDGNNYFRYSQPTFQTQYDINLYDYGVMLEGAFTETSATDWNRLYAAGRVHIDPVNHTWYIEDEKVASNMSVSVTMYSGGVGAGDRNVYLYVNGNTNHGTIPYNAGVDPLYTWVERTAYLNATADHVDHGHYWVYGYTRPTSGGWNYLGRHDASTFNSGLHSWFDTSTENTPATVTGQTWTYLPRDNNWMLNLSVNYTTTREVDELTDRIAQSTARTQTASTNDDVTTITGVRDTAIPVWSIEIAGGIGNNTFVKNATDTYIELNVGGVGWNYTTVDGEQYGVRTTAGGYQYMTPHASTHVFKTSYAINPPPNPTSLANTTGNFWINHTWSAGSGNVTDSYNVSINDIWHNATTNAFWNNTPLLPHGWCNATIYAFNTTDGGSLSTGSASQDTQIPNNPITITNTSDWSGIVGEPVYVDYDATDADSDTPTFSCNRTDLFTDFSTASGKGNWTADEGVYYVDFGVSDGWGSTSNYTMTLDASAIPPAPISLANTTGNFWIKHTWSPGSGITTDSYNVSVNDTWHNATTNTFWNNTPLSPHGWSNITVYAYNTTGTGTLSTGSASQDTQIPNNPITITNTSDWSGSAGGAVHVDYDSTPDADSDTPIFSCNRTDLFTDFSTATGIGNWVAAAGTHYVDFGVSDGWGSVDNYTMTITAVANPPDPTGIANTTGNFWVNHTWSHGSGIVTDSYNVSINSVWNNGTTATYNNTTYSAHAWQNIMVYAYNDTACSLSTGSASQDTQIPNNPITITSTGDWSGGVGGVVQVDYDATDADSDTPTFSCNRTDMFTDFSTASGKGNWTAVEGVIHVVFGVSDGYGSTDNYMMTITTIATPPTPMTTTYATGNFWVNHTWNNVGFITGKMSGKFTGYHRNGSTWQSDSAIAGGLGDIGGNSAPTVFQMDGVWYLIAGKETGVFNGYNWTGTTWQSDSAIAGGLGDIGSNSAPTVFQMDGVWYLIAGSWQDDIFGFNWNGSAWQSDSAIISGVNLPLSWEYPKPTVFYVSGTWYLIIGSSYRDFLGYNWAGSAWQSDSAIISGLGTAWTHVTPTVFCMDGTWHLITGLYAGGFFGYNWTGSAWQDDSVITDGLVGVGSDSTPTVFTVGDGADSYNVSANDVWHNGTPNTYWNDTYTPHAWQNITVYAWNDVAGSLSVGSVSRNTQIPNNPPIITNPADYLGNSGDNVYVDYDGVDVDGDTLTFSCDRTDIFTDFNTATGTGNGTALVGVYHVNFGVTDGGGGADNYVMSITGDEWWNSSWASRQRINLTNHHNYALDGWWVEMHIDTTQCYWSDCSDLRFIDAKTHAELEYYCDNGTGTPNLTTSELLFVKAPYMADSHYGCSYYKPTYAFIDCYWGNSNSVPTACAGAGSLYAFEDFNHGGDFPFNNWTPRDTSNGGVAIELRSAPDDYCLVMWSENLPGCGPDNPIPGRTYDMYPCDCSSSRPAFEYGMYGDKKILSQPLGNTEFHCVAKSTWSLTLVSNFRVCPTGTRTITSYPSEWDSWELDIPLLRPGEQIHLEPGFFDVRPGTQYGPYPVWVDNIDIRPHGNAAYQPDIDYGDVAGNLSYAIIYDANQNIVQHAQATIQNTATGAITERWKDIDDGIITFSAAGTYHVAVRTFDGVFVHTVTVSEVQVANITIPLNYNLRIHPEDQTGTPLTDVFCGLSEYTPLNPQAFWGMSMGGRQFVPVTNCSGFAMCDIYAEKGGYDDYEVTGLNWTSRTAMVKDYRHEVTMAAEP